jgi:hypothetical protein
VDVFSRQFLIDAIVRQVFKLRGNRAPVNAGKSASVRRCLIVQPVLGATAGFPERLWIVDSQQHHQLTSVVRDRLRVAAGILLMRDDHAQQRGGRPHVLSRARLGEQSAIAVRKKRFALGIVFIHVGRLRAWCITVQRRSRSVNRHEFSKKKAIAKSWSGDGRGGGSYSSGNRRSGGIELLMSESALGRWGSVAPPAPFFARIVCHGLEQTAIFAGKLAPKTSSGA